MQKLVDGIHRFQTQIFGSHRALFENLAHKQSPKTFFITCADSRVVPSLITQSKPGELFSLRNAGNIVPPHGSRGGEAATIEFAVAGLGIRDIVVCGHSHCGAMDALLDPGKLKDLPAMAAFLDHAEATRRILRENYRDRSEEALRTLAVEENVLVQLENLRTHPAVAAGLARRELRLHGWVYKLETGEIFEYDPVSSQYRAIARSEAPAYLPNALAAAR